MYIFIWNFLWLYRHRVRCFLLCGILILILQLFDLSRWMSMKMLVRIICSSGFGVLRLLTCSNGVFTCRKVIVKILVNFLRSYFNVRFGFAGILFWRRIFFLWKVYIFSKQDYLHVSKIHPQAQEDPEFNSTK